MNCINLPFSKSQYDSVAVWLQAKVAKSSSWRVWLGSWRSSSTGVGRNGKPGSGSLDAAVAAAAAATHPRSPAAQQVSKHPVGIHSCLMLLLPCMKSSRLLLSEAPVLIAEKRKLVFSFLFPCMKPVACQCACNMHQPMCDGTTLQTLVAHAWESARDSSQFQSQVHMYQAQMIECQVHMYQAQLLVTKP